MKKLLYYFALLLPFISEAQISFMQQTTPVSTGLLGINFANRDTGYACGDAGVILKTVDGGTTWIKLNSTTTKVLWDIKVVPGSDGQKVIVVGEDNTVIKSVDGGATWISQTIPFQTGSFVFGIHCLDDQNYFACGGDFATLSGAVLKTTNGGDTWTATAVNTSFFIDKIFMLNGTTGYIAGTNTSASDGSLHTTTNGNTWSLTKSSPGIITNVWATANDNIIAVGLAGQIWRSTDGGANWTSSSINSSDLFGVCFIDGQTGFACGGDQTGSMILTTIDSGKNWTKVNYAFGNALKAIAVAGNKVFVAGETGHIAVADISSLNVDELLSEYEFNITPNPANGYITFTGLSHNHSYYITATDMTGKVVLHRCKIDSKSGIDISSWPKGNYVLQLSDVQLPSNTHSRILTVK